MRNNDLKSALSIPKAHDMVNIPFLIQIILAYFQQASGDAVKVPRL